MRDILPLIEIPLPLMLLTPVFFLVFVGIALWVYRKGARPRYDRIGNLPLDDGSE